MYESLTVASTFGTIDPLEFLCFCRFRAQALAHPAHPVLDFPVHGVVGKRRQERSKYTPGGKAVSRGVSIGSYQLAFRALSAVLFHGPLSYRLAAEGPIQINNV